MRWVGIDVGARRKGLHVAVLSDTSELGVELAEIRGADATRRAAERLAALAPDRVAVDAPAAWAPPGRASRPCEADFARAGICGIRFTPDAATALARTDGYYDWVVHGLELWHALRSHGLPLIECFPTASWTQWAGPRRRRSRAAWSREALADLARRGLGGGERATNQDRRDAVAAALTARQAGRVRMRTFGPLVVPPAGSDPLDA